MDHHPRNRRRSIRTSLHPEGTGDADSGHSRPVRRHGSRHVAETGFQPRTGIRLHAVIQTQRQIPQERLRPALVRPHEPDQLYLPVSGRRIDLFPHRPQPRPVLRIYGQPAHRRSRIPAAGAAEQMVAVTPQTGPAGDIVAQVDLAETQNRPSPCSALKRARPAIQTYYPATTAIDVNTTPLFWLCQALPAKIMKRK